MEICFIVGPYQPGKCGISDFVSILSGELEKLGHSCEIKSIDPSTDSTFLTISQNLPECDLLSIQFAPYSFSTKGLSGNNLKFFGERIKNHSVQIIFHEIWIGDFLGANRIHKFKGWRQKREIMGFLKRVDPLEIFSTNEASLHALSKAGVKAKYLYLFGNIPFCGNDFSNPKPQTDFISVVLFGTIYENFPFPLALKRLEGISARALRKLKFHVVGRQREPNGIKNLRILLEKNNIRFEETGELPASEVSHYLQIADLGISTTPFDCLGKSGTTAAMLEHGLHVIAYDDSDTPDIGTYVSGPIIDQVILLNDKKMEDKTLRVLKKGKEESYVGVLKTVPAMLKNHL